MKKCSNCASVLNDTALFCTVCGSKVDDTSSQNFNTQQQGYNQNYNAQPQAYNQNFNTQNNQAYPQGNQFQPVAPTDNRRTYCILSYIGIFWLFGLLANPEKFDPRVRFNVGQGIIANIVSAIVTLLAIIVNAIAVGVGTVEKISIYGYYASESELSAGAIVIIVLVWLIAAGISAFFMINGIMKVVNNKDNYLPIIGKLAFYK